MKIGQFARDPSLVPALPKNATVMQTAEAKARALFVLRRARVGLDANPTWKGADPDEVKDASAPALKTLLSTEVTAAAAKVSKLRSTMADATKTELLAIDDASIDPPMAAAGKRSRFFDRYSSLFGLGPKQFRATGIITAAWILLANDPTQGDADLHTLVSRRLMVAERMLWYVGRADARAWGQTAANKWNGTDGWKRMFEYPRLPVVSPLVATCNLQTNSITCDVAGGLKGWTKQARYVHDFKVNDAATALWEHDPVEDYEFDFDKASGNDPVAAVKNLFTAQADYRKRNLLMCDQTIHCLLLEALIRVKSKRDGNTSWLKPLVDANPTGWLRIYYPSAYDRNPAGSRFLAARPEPMFFEVTRVGVEELMIGDHVIVYNHPAYDMAKDRDDVWRLENSVVVANSPRLLLQGHGTEPLPFSSTQKAPVKGEGEQGVLEPSMRRQMLGSFNNKLARLRKLVKDENTKANPRQTISGLGSAGVLVQRTDTGPYSGYDPTDFTPIALKLARWWIRWDHSDSKNEGSIAADSAWAQWVWDTQRVELVAAYGYFPLWLPRLKNGQPVRKNGKVSLLGEVWVSQSMAPGWNWYYEKNEQATEASAHHATVRRPKVS
jgi:hypothetical protein